MINTRDLTKVYHNKKRGKIAAVDHISFEANNGAIFGLLCPNGAGKTTTLRLLATFLQPTEGTAIIGGHDINKEAQQVRRQPNSRIREVQRSRFLNLAKLASPRLEVEEIKERFRLT
jgi:ABC-type multidrug transport system ATPase subunit